MANQLYPIFLKLHELNTLIVGAGAVGYEKLLFMLKSSPNARVTLVAPFISKEVKQLLKNKKTQVTVEQRAFEPDDLNNKDLVIAATNNVALNQKIKYLGRAQNTLVNVADTPQLCDFYLGGIVTKGNLKVAISTNGKSPTLAKRFRQLLEEALPEEIDELLDNLNSYRTTLKNDFDHKVKALNNLTKDLLNPINLEMS